MNLNNLEEKSYKKRSRGRWIFLLYKNSTLIKNLSNSRSWDYVITVCDNAKSTCPNFKGKVKHKLHMGFDDPALASGNEEEIMRVFERVRDEIYKEFYNFYVGLNL